MRLKGADLIHGNILKSLMKFSLPYLLSCFLQTFYGLADLFVTGQFCGADAIDGVSIGSQVTHMATVMIAGLAVGATVAIGRAAGEGKSGEIRKIIGNSVVVFAVFAAAATFVLHFFVPQILSVIQTPAEAVADAESYLRICFAGIPFIVAYNAISAIFRGLGDSVRPMIFVFIAGVVNIGLDFLFIGSFGMRAAGAAYATVAAQCASVVFCLFYIALGARKCRRKEGGTGASAGRKDDTRSGKGASVICYFRPSGGHIPFILKTGIPLMLQDGAIQISFLVITAIANLRGLEISTAVGITEKVITFLFLVPSAMMASVAAMAAQNIGGGQPERARKSMFCGMGAALVFGILAALVCNVFKVPIIGFFTSDAAVVAYGAQYLSSYVFDCTFAAIHFCFSGYFSACGKSYISFIQNVLSACVVRIPLAWAMTTLFPDTLYPMGWAAPAGSVFSSVFCIIVYVHMRQKNGREKNAGYSKNQ